MNDYEEIPNRSIWTGSRHWTDEDEVRRVLELMCDPEGRSDVTIVHGACPTGLDAIVDRIAREMGFQVEPHPADWDTHGKSAGPIRNQEMVDLDARSCIGFPLEGSTGTIDCMRKAWKAQIPTLAPSKLSLDVMPGDLLFAHMATTLWLATL